MSKLKIVRQIPFAVLVQRIAKRAVRKKKINYSGFELRSVGDTINITALVRDSLPKTEVSKDRIRHYLQHEFDLLGSGWISRNFGATQRVHPSHQEMTDLLFSLVDQDYRPIHWQKDVKSNHEYDVTQPYYEQQTPKGVDIKDLWELGRLQHLPQLAVAAAQGENKEALKSEFRNVCLDFIAANPVGMGVQWSCAMDVGIRVCNLLLAYDLFRGEFDDQFQQIFADSVYQHGQFILEHLEHKEGAAGNHYLFNLIGLLFVGFYLQDGALKRFAREEFEQEVLKQFFKDGGNFEGSTAYHCLSAEAVLYAAALLMRDAGPDEVFAARVNGMASMIHAMLKPNGEIPQFGDNDSGRLFKLANEEDNLLNYRSLLNAFSGICPFIEGAAGVHQSVVKQLAMNSVLPEPASVSPVFTSRNLTLSGRPFTRESIVKFGSTINLADLEYQAFPEFGLYIYRSDVFYLAISAIANEKMHHSWGHVHNDKLSFDLQVNGADLVKDPGTFVYTSDLQARNEFRSVKAHHGIVVEGVEQNKMIDPFYLERESVCKLLSSSPNEIILQAMYYGVIHERRFSIREDELVVTDYCNHPFEVNINKFPNYSPNYGIRQ
ncbi:MAG: alginate lyase family protein [Flavobacteriales bacterium]|nr:alginate lyase family protein [Flavobacteriales bacterium]